VATTILLSCDKCDGQALYPVTGTATDARVEHFKHGWVIVVDPVHGTTDLCPVCSNRDPDYYLAEPF
jgi:hypothetical protein